MLIERLAKVSAKRALRMRPDFYKLVNGNPQHDFVETVKGFVASAIESAVLNHLGSERNWEWYETYTKQTMGKSFDCPLVTEICKEVYIDGASVSFHDHK